MHAELATTAMASTTGTASISYLSQNAYQFWYLVSKGVTLTKSPYPDVTRLLKRWGIISWLFLCLPFVSFPFSSQVCGTRSETKFYSLKVVLTSFIGLLIPTLYSILGYMEILLVYSEAWEGECRGHSKQVHQCMRIMRLVRLSSVFQLSSCRMRPWKCKQTLRMKMISSYE